MDFTTASTLTVPPSPMNADHQTRLLAANKAACLQKITDIDSLEPKHGGWCPAVWDGILCWGRAAPGQLLSQRCPAYIAGFHSQANASKLCTEEGQWFARESTVTWTNYTLCYSGPDATVIVNIIDLLPQNETYIEPYLSTLKLISEVGHTISLLSLVVAFTILVSFKRLRCPRNVLHMHLFASFIMRAFMSLLKDSLFVQGLGMTTDLLMKDEGSYFNIEQQVNWPCRMIICLWQYFIMANYSWILMEGLYLHNLIFLALFTDSSSIGQYIFMGWGLPAVFVLSWALCRAFLENTWCWTTNDITLVYLLIRVPTITSVALNFILFINIIRVLLLKIRSSVSEENQTYRRWAKSTLVLVPLFGVHYVVFLGLHFITDNTVEIVWLFCDQLFSSFNGFFVALLYCFLNGEVKSEICRKWNELPLCKSLPRRAAEYEQETDGIFGKRSGGESSGVARRGGCNAREEEEPAARSSCSRGQSAGARAVPAHKMPVSSSFSGHGHAPVRPRSQAPTAGGALHASYHGCLAEVNVPALHVGEFSGSI